MLRDQLGVAHQRRRPARPGPWPCARPRRSSRGGRRWRRAGCRRRARAGSPPPARTPWGPGGAPSSDRAAALERAVAGPVLDDVLGQRGARRPRRRPAAWPRRCSPRRPRAFTQDSTTPSSALPSSAWLTSCWYCPTPIDLGSIFTSSASGILQAAADGHRAAHGDVLVGQLLAGDLRGRVDRGAALVDRHHQAAPRAAARPSSWPARSVSVSRPAVPLPMATASMLVAQHQRGPPRGGRRRPGAAARAGRSPRAPAACRSRPAPPPCSRCGSPGPAPAAACPPAAPPAAGGAGSRRTPGWPRRRRAP